MDFYQRIIVFSVIFMKVSFICGFSSSEPNCNETFTENGVLIYNSSDSNETSVCFNIVAPIGSRILFVLRARDVKIDENSLLKISEMAENFTDIFVFGNGTNITDDSIYANSVTNEVTITFVNGDIDSLQESSFVIPFQIESNDNSTTIYTDPSGVIASNGSYDKGLNYVHTFLVNVDQVNHIYLFLNDLHLDDETGDFLVIGSGGFVLNGSTAVLMTGVRKKYPPITIESDRAYLRLYAKNYSESSWRFSFNYETSYVVPPTDEPSTTEAPPTPLNVTIKYDLAKENFTSVVIKFTRAIQKYATSYCRGEFLKNGTVSNVTTNVTVVEAAVTDPCLVLVFYVFLMGSDTCAGHRPFLVQDFENLMNNYGSQIEDQFGKSIMSSCGMDVTVWIVVVAIVFCISLTLTIIVSMTTDRSDKYRKLAKSKDASGTTITTVASDYVNLTDTSVPHQDSIFTLSAKEDFKDYNGADSDEDTYYERKSSMKIKNNEVIQMQKVSVNRGVSFATFDRTSLNARSPPKRMVSYPPTHSAKTENIYDEVDDSENTLENAFNETKM